MYLCSIKNFPVVTLSISTRFIFLTFFHVQGDYESYLSRLYPQWCDYMDKMSHESSGHKKVL